MQSHALVAARSRMEGGFEEGGGGRHTPSKHALHNLQQYIAVHNWRAEHHTHTNTGSFTFATMNRARSACVENAASQVRKCVRLVLAPREKSPQNVCAMRNAIDANVQARRLLARDLCTINRQNSRENWLISIPLVSEL